MGLRHRFRWTGAAVAGVLVASALGGPAQAGRVTAPVGRVSAGPTGPAIVLADGLDVHGLDVWMDEVGTAYVGFVAGTPGASDRTVHLCVLPQDATACDGGLRSIASLGPSSAAGLRVLQAPSGPVTLLWFHDTDQSVNGPMNAQLAQATYSSGTLNPAVDVAPAPSFGSLRTAEVGPDGLVYAVMAPQAGQGGDDLQVIHGLGKAAVTVSTPWLAGRVALGFHDGLPVLVANKYGAVSERLQAARQRADRSYTSFAAVKRTWTVGNENGGAFDLGQARSGLRLVAPVDDARYFPQVARWTGTDFAKWSLTGDRNACAPTSHDLFADDSGRLADTSFECSKITVVNQPKAAKAAVVRFDAGGTTVGDPQIASSPRGDAWVAWTVSKAGGGHLLRVRPVMLPALSTTRAKAERGGRAVLTGPVSCLPGVDTKVKVAGRPASGWKVLSKSLRLDGVKQDGTLDGASLAPDSKHTLTGVVVFGKGGQRSKATAKLTFISCPAPSVPG